MPLALILLIFTQIISSQVVVERSKDKVIISGVPYYIHQVKKGETAYSISKAYGITVDELTRQNPSVVYGTKEGQTLNIKVSTITEPLPATPVIVNAKHDETRFVYHNLKPGETVYFLSKTYNVSEEEIISSNPGIDITKLSVGTELAIPRKELPVKPEKSDKSVKYERLVRSDKPEITDNQEKSYILHQVQKGESLSSIAGKYGLTVRDLLLQAGYHVVSYKGNVPFPSRQWLRDAQRADALITLLDNRIDKKIIESLTKCRVIANYAVGFNNIDVQAAK